MVGIVAFIMCLACAVVPALIWFVFTAFGLFWIGAFVALMCFLASVGPLIDASKGA